MAYRMHVLEKLTSRYLFKGKFKRTLLLATIGDDLEVLKTIFLDQTPFSPCQNDLAKQTSLRSHSQRHG